ncbi:hypothetical protein JOC78_000421 [Bacillus ectoiniformans]|nr:hypothetical protein [Bacillus ectoiniformans]MBM7647500.1 hypothetical protein [Bacillus ectoiniformans]
MKRTLTKDVDFINPFGRYESLRFTKAYNEILKIIDYTPGYELNE